MNGDGPIVSVVGSFPADIDISTMVDSYFDSGLMASWDSVTLDAVHSMVDCGVELVSDGQVRDMFTNIFLRGLSGCRVRDRAEVVGPVGYIHALTLDDVEVALEAVPKGIGVLGLLAGPFTLVRSVVDQFYGNEKELAFDFARALNLEAHALERQGVEMIGIDEPFYSNEYPEYADELIAVVTKDIEIPVRLHVCGEVGGIVDRLIELPVDMLSHEFKRSPKILNAFEEYGCNGKDICLGSVRSDNAQVESVSEVIEHINQGKEVFGEHLKQVSPDCGLRMMPHRIALQKLRCLSKARNEVY